MNKFNKSLLAASIFAAIGSMTAGVALATDHGDTVLFSDGKARNDARITDFFSLNRGDKIAFIIDTNPTVGNRGMENGARSDTQPRPETQLEYVFPTDVAFTANIDNHSDVSFNDPVRNAQHGGTVVNPAGIKENFTFTFTYDSANQLHTSFKSTDTALRISGFYPTEVKPGDLVYVLGSGFKSDETKVKVNGRSAGLSYVVSDNVLVFVAPAKGSTGKVSITTETEGAGDDEEIKVRVTSASDLAIKSVSREDDDDNHGVSAGAKALRDIANNSAAVAKVQAGDVSGLADIGLPVKTFAGLRDDPFIRTDQQGRNIAAMGVELPQSLFTHGVQKVLLTWSASTFNSIAGYSSDVAGRSFATMFPPENAVLNTRHPSEHLTALANVTMPCQTAYQPFPVGGNLSVPQILATACADDQRMLKAPDVIIFDTAKTQDFPNGRELTNDQIDYIGTYDPRVERVRRLELNPAQNIANFVICAAPTKNDVAHSTEFPYLGLPFTAYPGEAGNTGGNCN